MLANAAEEPDLSGGRSTTAIEINQILNSSITNQYLCSPLHKAEIERLQTEAETSLRQNTYFQTEIKKLKSEDDEKRTSSLQKIQRKCRALGMQTKSNPIHGATVQDQPVSSCN